MSLFSGNNNVITYTVNKVSTSNLCVSVQNGEVVINAPWYATNMQIQRAVEEKKQWILNKIAEYNESCRIKNTKIQKVKVLGKDFDLLVQYKMVKVPSLNFENEQINVILPYQFKKMQVEDIVQTLMNKMYEKIAEKEIERAMEKTRIMLEIAPEDYEIQRMTNPFLLAKCVEQKITINPDIVMYSRDVIDYVVLHEFCHLKYKNHTKSFYNMLKTYMPNYEKIAKELKGVAY